VDIGGGAPKRLATRLAQARRFHACERSQTTQVGLALAIAPQPVLPSASLHGVGTLDVNFLRFNTLPACSPVNASPASLRMLTHDSGSS